MGLKSPAMNDTGECHWLDRSHRGEHLLFRHTCLLNDVSYIWIVRHNNLDIKNGVDNKQSSKRNINTNNYLKEIVQRNKPPVKGEVVLLVGPVS